MSNDWIKEIAFKINVERENIDLADALFSIAARVERETRKADADWADSRAEHSLTHSVRADFKMVAQDIRAIPASYQESKT